MLRPYQGMMPIIHPTAFVEESAQVVGSVSVDCDSSIWHNAVLRGDVNTIHVGERSNIQDGVVVHGTFEKYPVVIGSDVSIGHNAVVHGCTIHANCLIGIGAIILDNADVGENCIIGAGALVTESMVVAPGSLVLGVPGRITRQLTEDEIQGLRERAARYVMYKNAYSV